MKRGAPELASNHGKRWLQSANERRIGVMCDARFDETTKLLFIVLEQYPDQRTIIIIT
jgi:hypothetical protein